MISEEKKSAAIVLCIIMAVFLFVAGIYYMDTTSKASQQCYDDFAPTYTWEQARPTLDKIWADKFITRGECKTMNEAYDAARESSDISNIQGVVDEYKQI